MLAADRGFLGDARRLRLGNLAAHAFGGFHHGPNLILGFAVVPNPSNQPSASILGLHCADMASVQHDFAATLGWKIKVIAPTPWRWYMSHCFVPSNLPRFVRGIFCALKIMTRRRRASISAALAVAQ